MILTRNQIFIFIIAISFGLIHGIKRLKVPDSDDSKKLEPCQACKMVVGSILHGMSRTNKKHFGGGDTAWEEEKLGDYAQSEVRLVEVQENLCSELVKGQSQCYSLSEEWEPLIEEWWFKQKELGALHDWLCVKKVQYCCAPLHYGPECKPCPGYPHVCSYHGSCNGSETMKGNGKCICNEGYKGETCSECAENYYLLNREESKFVCSRCDVSCKGSCTKAGEKGCLECNLGYFKDGENGCLDINECESNNACKPNQFCRNTAGSYSCLECDNSCNGCRGSGPGMCQKCSVGYTFKDGLCVGGQKSSSDWTRYLSYLGLCIVTFIIFQKNTVIASIIGILVAIYVAVSEYMLGNLANQNNFFQSIIDSLIKAIN